MPSAKTLKTGDSQPNKALQRTRLSDGCFPWRSVHAAELDRYVAQPEVSGIRSAEVLSI